MISDFGLSKMEGKGDVMSTACGTPGYVGKHSVCVSVSALSVLKRSSLARDHSCLRSPRGENKKAERHWNKIEGKHFPLKPLNSWGEILSSSSVGLGAEAWS